MKTRELTPGKAYNVRMYRDIKDKKPGITVRRIFKHTEKRFNSIDCFVFTAKVKREVSCTVELGESKDHNGIKFFHWRGINTVPNEFSVPYYMIASIEEARP